MDNKNINSINKSIAFIGNNFVNKHLYENFKRYSKLKPYIFNNIKDVSGDFDYVLDCSFNKKHQDQTIKSSDNINKLLIINHWKRNIKCDKNINIIQLIIPDIYGIEHDSFNRSGNSNNFDNNINYCTLICESIRRIHDSKYDFIPNTYIDYGESKLKYIYVDNLYKPIQYVIDNINYTSEFEIYDDEKDVTNILSSIKNIIGYEGSIIFNNTEKNFNNLSKKLKFKYNHKSIDNYIRIIYNNLIRYNDRFKIY
jgi:hypothetical protein